MEELTRLAIQVLRNINPSSDFSSDIVGYLMYCVYLTYHTEKIVNSDMESAYKIDDILSYMKDTRHIQIGCLLADIEFDIEENNNG